MRENRKDKDPDEIMSFPGLAAVLVSASCRWQTKWLLRFPNQRTPLLPLRSSAATSPNCLLAWRPFIVADQELRKSHALSKLKSDETSVMLLMGNICYLPRTVCGQNKCYTFLGKWSNPPRSSSSMETPVVIPRNVTLCRTNTLSGKKVNMPMRMKMKMLTKVMMMIIVEMALLVMV